MEIKVMENVMKSNEDIAAENRSRFDEAGVYTVNLLGSPGSGKTTVLEKTLSVLAPKIRAGVIEGDLYTSKDAERIERCGMPVVQINTVGGCHLDSKMISKVLPHFNLAEIDMLIIENVGNLVCPAAYDLGEHDKVVVLSIAEGGDKPLKYPRIFLESRAVIINKMDLLPFSDVDMTQLKNDILSINPQIELFEISCRTGQGLDSWTDWLVKRVAAHGKSETFAG